MRKLTINPQLLYLFFSNLTILFVGMGLFPILPLYAAEFGADRGLIGLFFAAIYTTLTAGSLVVGWLSNRIDRKKLFVFAGIAGVPALFLLGFASQLWQVLVLTAIVWFCGGIDIALVNVLTGLQSKGQNRGKSFSLISLSIPFGSLIGAATVGAMVSSAGYSAMFIALGIVWALLPVMGLAAIDFPHSAGPQPNPGNPSLFSNLGGKRYVVLLGVALLSATAINTGRLGMSLSMHELSFSPRAIASAATISGLVTIPLTLLIGAISDRLGKRQSLWFVYLLAAGGVLVLSGATQLWQFWLAASLTLLAFCTNGAITSAFAAELIPTGGLTRGLSWVNTTISAGAILSFLGTGYLMDLLGPKGLFLITSTLPVVAASIVQLLPPKTLTTIPALPRSDTCSDPNALGEHRTPLLQTTNGCM